MYESDMFAGDRARPAPTRRAWSVFGCPVRLQDPTFCMAFSLTMNAFSLFLNQSWNCKPQELKRILPLTLMSSHHFGVWQKERKVEQSE